MLRYSPKQQPLSAMLFSVSCGAAALVLYALSSAVAHRFVLLPIVSMTVLALGVWFLYRFALLSYRYEIRGDVLCVVRRLFGRENTIYTLSLRTAVSVVPADKAKSEKGRERPIRTHNFLPSWPHAHAVILYYRDAGKLCSVILEDNPAFFAAAAQYFTKSE